MNKKIVEDIQKRIESHYGRKLFANILAFYPLSDGFHVIVSVWENEDQNLDSPDYCNGSNIVSPPLVFVIDSNNQISDILSMQICNF